MCSKCSRGQSPTPRIVSVLGLTAAWVDRFDSECIAYKDRRGNTFPPPQIVSVYLAVGVLVVAYSAFWYICRHTNLYVTRFRIGVGIHGLARYPHNLPFQHVSETDTPSEAFTLTIRGGGGVVLDTSTRLEQQHNNTTTVTAYSGTEGQSTTSEAWCATRWRRLPRPRLKVDGETPRKGA